MCTWENAPHTTTNQRYSESRALQKCSVTQLKAAHKVWSIVCGCSEDKRPGLQLGPAEDSPSFRRPWGRLISTDHSAHPLVRCPCAQDHIPSSSESRDSAGFLYSLRPSSVWRHSNSPASHYGPEHSLRDPRGPSPAPLSMVRGLPKRLKTCLFHHRPHSTR